MKKILALLFLVIATATQGWAKQVCDTVFILQDAGETNASCRSLKNVPKTTKISSSSPEDKPLKPSAKKLLLKTKQFLLLS
jgi:hypothetical protein